MAFLESRLSPRIERGSSGGPTNPGRTKAYTRSGKLSQGFAASAPIHKYDVSHGIRSAEDFAEVQALWYVVNFKPYAGFRFKDHRDFVATRANTTLTLISGSTYQLQRTYTFAGESFVRDIFKPVTGTVTVYNAAGTPLTATIDYTTGQADVSGTPDSWAGEFDVPVTFVDNEWMSDLEVHTDNLHVRSQPIKLEEIRL